MSRVQSESESSQAQQQEEEYPQPRTNKRPKRKNNLLNKIFTCLCGKKYSSVAAWYTHYKKHDNDSEERRRQIKQAFDDLCDRIFERPAENDPQITIQDIPTFHQEASHKENSDLAFASICTEWRSRPAQTFGKVDDNIFDRKKYRVQGDIFSFEDLITRRREGLFQNVQDLLQQYSLQELYIHAGSMNEFRDYKLIKEPFVGRQTLNFAWDLVKYFKPTFAAKMQVFLYALCCKDQIDLDNWQEWRDFNAAQLDVQSFIMPILEQYHDEWLTGKQNFFYYQ